MNTDTFSFLNQNNAGEYSGTADGQLELENRRVVRIDS